MSIRPELKPDEYELPTELTFALGQPTVLRGLSSGRYSLTVSAPGAADWNSDIAIDASKTLPVRLVAGTDIVIVRVVFANGRQAIVELPLEPAE